MITRPRIDAANNRFIMPRTTADTASAPANRPVAPTESPAGSSRRCASLLAAVLSLAAAPLTFVNAFAPNTAQAAGIDTCDVANPGQQREVPHNRFVLLSMPCDAPSDQATIADVLGDDVPGTYGQDWVVWRYDVNANNGSGGYFGGPDIDINTVEIPAGEGFWLLYFNEEQPLITVDLPAGSTIVDLQAPDMTAANPACTSANGCFVSTIAGGTANTRYQLLGNPFPAPVNPAKQRVVSSSPNMTCLAPAGCDLTTSSNETITQAFMWAYDETASSYVQIGVNAPIQIGPNPPRNTLVRWAGAWIGGLENGEGASLYWPLEQFIFDIGDTGPGGGTVFSVSEDGLSGLEFAPQVLTDAQPNEPDLQRILWGCAMDLIGIPNLATSADLPQGVQSGEANVSAFTECETPSPAADAALGYASEPTPGFFVDDWYLPSMTELLQIRSQFPDVQLIRSDGETRPIDRFSLWSSTEQTGTSVWFLLSFDGEEELASKIEETQLPISVLPVRTF